jgi:SAM-dependent methyltransferase
VDDDEAAPASPLTSAELWEQHSQWWIDGFTGGADPEYDEQILPLAAGELTGATSVLDVGCGEGQISRLAARLDGVDRVVGVDPTWNQISAASERAGGVAYARAAAHELPFGDATFGAVVACLVFEHIDEVDAAISEVARVLVGGGRFCFFLNHPLLQTPDSGWIDDQAVEPPEQYWRVGRYLEEAETLEEVELGVHIRFIHRPLSRYVNALADVGLPIERMIEPQPPPGFLALAPEYTEAAMVPRLLYMRCRRT